MKNIHILPTEKPSRLWLSTRKENYLIFDKFPRGGVEYIEPKHIYITSDEEIKHGDYVIRLDVNTVFIAHEHGKPFPKYFKKIILSTDPELIKDGVQAINDEFLEWFVKNPSCEWVEVVYGVIRLTENDNKGYWISIPNVEFNMSIEEPRQETLEVMKKEQTIEQASEYYAHNYFDMHETSNYQALKQGFINGAKWQQEQNKTLYSEEEAIQKIIDYVDFQFNTNGELNHEIIKWFEQFKKK